MSIRELLNQREEVNTLIEDELRAMTNWSSSCECKKVITVELVRYSEPDEGGPAVQLESHCIECGGYVEWQ